MQKTEFKIPKMDCSAEEQMIRMKLGSVSGIQGLRFDLQARKLEVFHSGTANEILTNLEQLKMGAHQVSHEGHASIGLDTSTPSDGKGPLIAALAINLTLFLVEFVAGIMAYSLGLIGDSLDMLTDAVVYAMALSVVGGTVLQKKSLARKMGYLQSFLACAGLIEVIRRAVAGEGIPDFRAMILFSAIALVGNGITLLLLSKAKGAGAHMKAAWICTSVDVQVNALVIASGLVVYFTRSGIPDLVVGAIIFLLVANGARKILALGSTKSN